ncbi:MAG TPA: 50S ribosomal protein L9 [Pyrinomonadaceae bacterium]|nr:50S ribosomal protein L9 [Pyrinomonadaceae bacterium]
MATTTVLLREDIDTLGGRGEIVKVRSGYARNFLLPQGLATLATKGNIKQIEGERAALLKKAAVEKATAEAQREMMGPIELEFERKAGDGGTLFGSVTSMDIAAALQGKGYEIDRKKIVLRDPIKETGEYTVKVKLHREVTLEVPVKVSAEGGEVVEAKPEKKARKAKAESSAPAVEETAEAATEEPSAETEN